MISTTKSLALVLSTLTLVACGGGGGGGASNGAVTSPPTVPAVSLASSELAKYEGVWRQDCVDHMLRTTTLVATSANEFTVTPREDYFAYKGCTGAVIATGTYGGPSETVQYRSTLQDSSVELTPGNVIIADVEPATSKMSTASFSIAGSGVFRSTIIDDIQGTTLIYADGSSPLKSRPQLFGETTEGGLLLYQGELLALVPGNSPAAAFKVNQRFFR